ncbi:hypothetical protein MASR2M47_44070 [Draconibacterium sp.]|jgi:hypothetical protein
MFRIPLVLIIALFCSISSFAQDTIRKESVPIETYFVDDVPNDTVIVTSEHSQDPKPALSKIYYGGYLNLSFGTYTSIGVVPMFAYKITPKLSTGTKLSYQYLHYKDGPHVNEESNYGFSLFNRLRVTPQFYAHAEFSSQNYKFYNDLGESERKWVPFLFVGGGYSVPISNNTWFNTEVLFDVLQNENSPYAAWEPFFSVGFGVGF